MFSIIFLLGCIGLLISFYIRYIEIKLEKNAMFQPLCDISNTISCSRIIQSPYSKMFNIQNSIWALQFYTVIMILSLFELTIFIRYFSFTGALLSSILGFLMYTRIHTACILCILLYIINALLLLISHLYR